MADTLRSLLMRTVQRFDKQSKKAAVAAPPRFVPGGQGGATIAGTFYQSGEKLPEKVLKGLPPEERQQLEAMLHADSKLAEEEFHRHPARTKGEREGNPKKNIEPIPPLVIGKAKTPAYADKPLPVPSYEGTNRYRKPTSPEEGRALLPGPLNDPAIIPDNEAMEITPFRANQLVEMFNAQPPDLEWELAAKGGRSKRGWYKHAAANIVELFGDEAPRFAALLAATSPNEPVRRNFEKASILWNRYQKWMTQRAQAGNHALPTPEEVIREIHGWNAALSGTKEGRLVNGMLSSYQNAAAKALSLPDPGRPGFHVLGAAKGSGPKIDSFRQNLLGDFQQVTNDVWMSYFGDYDQGLIDSVAGPYLGASAKVRLVAKRLNENLNRGEKPWTPAEIQETVWSFTRALAYIGGISRFRSDMKPLGPVEALNALTHETVCEQGACFASLLVKPNPDGTENFVSRQLRAAGYGKALDRIEQATAEQAEAFAKSQPTGLVSTPRSPVERQAHEAVARRLSQYAPSFSTRQRARMYQKIRTAIRRRFARPIPGMGKTGLDEPRLRVDQHRPGKPDLLTGNNDSVWKELRKQIPAVQGMLAPEHPAQPLLDRVMAGDWTAANPAMLAMTPEEVKGFNLYFLGSLGWAMDRAGKTRGRQTTNAHILRNARNAVSPMGSPKLDEPRLRIDQHQPKLPIKAQPEMENHQKRFDVAQRIVRKHLPAEHEAHGLLDRVGRGDWNAAERLAEVLDPTMAAYLGLTNGALETWRSIRRGQASQKDQLLRNARRLVAKHLHLRLARSAGALPAAAPAPQMPAPAMPANGIGAAQSHGGPASIAVSPNVDENLSHDDAYQRMRSGNTTAFKKIAEGVLERLGIKGKTYPALGDWADGAENSILQQIDDPPDRDTVRYAAAWYGLLGNQKAVLSFYPQHDGVDSLYSIQVPESDLVAIRKALDASGIPFRTLVPKGGGVRVVVYDQKRQLRDKVAAFAGQYNAHVDEQLGSGEFIGGDSSRSASRAAYRKIIDSYESARGRSGGSIPQAGQSLRSDYGGSTPAEETAAEGMTPRPMQFAKAFRDAVRRMAKGVPSENSGFAYPTRRSVNWTYINGSHGSHLRGFWDLLQRIVREKPQSHSAAFARRALTGDVSHLDGIMRDAMIEDGFLDMSAPWGELDPRWVQQYILNDHESKLHGEQFFSHVSDLRSHDAFASARSKAIKPRRPPWRGQDTDVNSTIKGVSGSKPRPQPQPQEQVNASGY